MSAIKKTPLTIPGVSMNIDITKGESGYTSVLDSAGKILGRIRKNGDYVAVSCVGEVKAKTMASAIKSIVALWVINNSEDTSDSVVSIEDEIVGYSRKNGVFMHWYIRVQE